MSEWMSVCQCAKMFNCRFVRNTPFCINRFYLVCKLLNHIFVSINFSMRYRFDSILLRIDGSRFELLEFGHWHRSEHFKPFAFHECINEEVNHVSIASFWIKWVFFTIFFNETSFIYRLTTTMEGEDVGKHNEVDWFFPFLIEFKKFPFDDVESVRKKVSKFVYFHQSFVSNFQTHVHYA